MSEFVYKDYLPANARVIVDYTAKEKVKFSYPIDWSYRKAVWKRGFPTIFSFWIILHTFWAFYLGLYTLPLLALYIILFPISFIVPATEATIAYINFQTMLLPRLLIALWIVGVPALITLFLSRDKEKLSYWLPKMGYWASNLLNGTKETIFEPKDITNNKAIIPSFSNIYLNYKTSGKFNDYLEKVEIMEIPFSYKRRRLFTPWKKKKTKNDYEFRAVFYFTKKPTYGNMEVEFN